MKGHILHILTIGFILLLAGRAVKVSSSVLDPNIATLDKPGAAIVDAKPQNAGMEPAVDTKTASIEGHADKTCLTGDVLDVILADRAALDNRESTLLTRETTLKALEGKLKQQIIATEHANSVLEERINILKTTANEDISHLVSMYETMKAKQAARIFDSMDPAFSAGFLRAMDSRKAGLILAEMDSRKSYAVSLMIAKRNSSYRDARK